MAESGIVAAALFLTLSICLEPVRQPRNNIFPCEAAEHQLFKNEHPGGEE